MSSDSLGAGVDRINERLKEKLQKFLPQPGKTVTPLEGLLIARRDAPVQAESCFYRPLVGLIAQGRKSSVIGNDNFDYGPGQYIVSGVDMPSITNITEASPDKPFLSLSITLDRYLITQLAAEVPPDGRSAPSSPLGIGLARAAPDILEAFLRLLGLLETPGHLPILGPMILREIHYHLLTGPLGGSLRSISTLGSQSNQVAQAITWLRGNFREQLVIGQLASRVNMSESSFHRHFRQVTSISPLQFQKRLRLYEAQRLMLADNLDATTAAFEVGYESTTQFNREYKREFGQPPYRDVSRMRSAGIGPEM